MQHEISLLSYPCTPQAFDEPFEAEEFAVGQEIAGQTVLEAGEGGAEWIIDAEGDEPTCWDVTGQEEVVGLKGESAAEGFREARKVEGEVCFRDASICDVGTGRLFMESVSHPEEEAGGHFREEIGAVGTIDGFDERAFVLVVWDFPADEDIDQVSAWFGIEEEAFFAVFMLEVEAALEGAEVFLVHAHEPGRTGDGPTVAKRAIFE